MSCAIYGCNKDSQSKAHLKDIRFFRFPTKNIKICKLWETACGRADRFKSCNARMCSLHFEQNCYERNLKHELLNYEPKNYRKLKADAIPTLLLPKTAKEKSIVDGAICERIAKRSRAKLIDKRTKKREKRISNEQKHKLLEFVIAHPEMAAIEGTEINIDLWSELARSLNSNTGPTKTAEIWRNIWIRYVQSTKKAMLLKDKLNDFEVKLLEFLQTLDPQIVATEQTTNAILNQIKIENIEESSSSADPLLDMNFVAVNVIEDDQNEGFIKDEIEDVIQHASERRIISNEMRVNDDGDIPCITNSTTLNKTMLTIVRNLEENLSEQKQIKELIAQNLEMMKKNVEERQRTNALTERTNALLEQIARHLNP